MGSYKDNLEEKYELYEYRKKERWFYLIVFTMFAFIIVFFFSRIVGDGVPAKHLWFRVPFLHGTARTDTILIVVFLLFLWWSKGTKIPFLKQILSKLPVIGKGIEKGGMEKYLEDFFYPETEFSDGIKRGKGFHYFSYNGVTVDNLFDFGKYSHSDKKGELTGTERIKLCFRDKEQEALRKDVRSLRNKRAKKAQKQLDALIANSGGKPTEKQSLLYHDLFLMLEGIYNSYANDYGDKIFIGKHLKNPIKIIVNKKSRQIADIAYDSSVDVFSDGKVYFNIEMIQSTVITLTRLYVIFLEKRVGRGRFSNLDPSMLERFEMLFKFFMMRRLLLSYSNIPAGWLCVKIEDYTMRAVASNIDREMIIDINEKNDGSSPVYHSDVEASQFLFTYWAFMYERKIRKIMEDLAFSFNASKEVKEINARKVALKAMEEIEKEHKETYDAIKDEDLVILPPKDVEQGV